MVQVPVVQGNSVQIAARQVGAVRPVELDNGLGEGLQNASRALGQAAEQEGQIQEIYAQAAILDEENKFAIKEGENATEFANLKGAAPAQEMEERLAALDIQRKFAVDNAPERARLRMKRMLDIRYERARLGMQRHADVEMFQFRDAGLASSIEIASKEAVLGYGTDQFDFNLSIAKLRLQERGKLNEWHPDQLAAETAKLNAGIKFDAVIGVAASGNPTAALEQAEVWKDEFEPEQYSRLNSILRPRAVAKRMRERAKGDLDSAAAAAAPREGSSAVANRSATPIGNAKSVAEQVYPGIQITSHRRKAGAAGKAGSRSWHVKSGAAIDSAPISGITFQQYVQGYRDRGFEIIEAVDETDPATMKRTGATGPHWHVVLGEKGSGGDAGGAAAAALDPRLDPDFAESVARTKAKEEGLAEDETDAYIDAMRDEASANLQRRNFVEQEEERQFNEIIVEKGIDLDQITDESQIPADAIAGTSPSFQMRLGQTIAGNRDRIAKERAAAVEAAQLQAAVMAGGAIDYSDPKVKKRASTLYAQQLAAQGQLGTDQLMTFNIRFASRFGIVPPVLKSQITAQLQSPDPNLQIAAATTVEEMRVRNPALLGAFSPSELARAEQINQYRRRGVKPADAAARMAEMERMPKADRDGRKSLFAEQAKEAGGATEFLKGEYGVAPTAVLLGEFRAAWQSEFIRLGDIDLARKTAFATLKNQWGVSYVNQREQLMKYPPEMYYGRLDRGERDAAWIREQAYSELYGGGVSGPEPGKRFELVLWDRTPDGNPLYVGKLLQPSGEYVTAVDDRGRPKLYRPDFSQSAAAKRIQQKRNDNVERARKGMPPPTANANPGWKL